MEPSQSNPYNNSDDNFFNPFENDFKENNNNKNDNSFNPYENEKKEEKKNNNLNIDDDDYSNPFKNDYFDNNNNENNNLKNEKYNNDENVNPIEKEFKNNYIQNEKSNDNDENVNPIEKEFKNSYIQNEQYNNDENTNPIKKEFKNNNIQKEQYNNDNNDENFNPIKKEFKNSYMQNEKSNNNELANPFEQEFKNNNIQNEKSNNNEDANPFEQEFKNNNIQNERTNNNELANPFEQEFKNNNIQNEKSNDNELANPFQQEFKNNQNNNDDFSNPFQNVDFNNNINENNINNNNYNPYSKNDNINSNNNFNPYSNNNINENNPFENNLNANPFNHLNNNNDNNNYNKNNNINNHYNNNFNNYNNNFNNNNFNQNNNNFNQNNNNFNQSNNNFSQNNNNFNQNNNNFNQNYYNPNNYLNQNNNNFYQNNNNNNYNNYSNQNNNNNFNNPKNDLINIKSSINKLENQPKIVIKNEDIEEFSNENDMKKIKAIISKCEYMFNTATNLYESFDIREALATLCKAIKGLDSLKNTINTQKQHCLPLLPQITALRNRSFSTLQQYRIMVYKLISIKFKPILYRPYENENESLINFCSRYITSKIFISSDDIFDNAAILNSLNKNMTEGKMTGNKCFLIYGPKGCGKTLYIHALANHIGAKIAQIEGIELFKIPFFSREFMKACFSSIQFKPLIIYIKNIEQMFSTLNNLNYIYDKVASSYQLNVYFFASSSINVYNLPKQITDKFQHFQCIKPIVKNRKADFIRFISIKIGIEIKMDQQSLNNFASNKLDYYSNEDIFDLIRNAIDIKKQNSPPDDENWVYREGLYEEDIMKAYYKFKGSLTDEVLRSYYI